MKTILLTALALLAATPAWAGGSLDCRDTKGTVILDVDDLEAVWISIKELNGKSCLVIPAGSRIGRDFVKKCP
jgi:hypothetical protein